MAKRWSLPLVALALCLVPTLATASDWIHWRGPNQTGQSFEKNLPDYFEVTEVGKNNLIWKQPFGGRSAPLVMKGRIYTIGGYDMSLVTEGERILCFDEMTGKKLWEKRFNVFHTDIVSSRLGWTTMSADPETETIYAHTTGGFLFALDKEGKEVWSRQLTEEFGRVTGYGGRIVSPLYDSGLVIIGMVNGSWGDQARGNNRFVAFDAKTGAIVWWSSPTEELKTPSIALRGTYYSNPVVATIGGQRVLISGAADGCIHGLKLRTGERLWSYHFSAGVVNPSPVVDGNLVYISHGEENPDGGPIGRVVCLDASKIDPKTKKPAVVWENKKLAKRFGLASPALAEGRLYIPEDASELSCFNAKTGKLLWRQKYGTVSRGAPLIADGKLYIFDVNAKLAVFKLKGDEEPEELETVAFRKEMGAGFVETHGTPIAVNGHLYFLTQENLYCIGKPEAQAEATERLPSAAEAPLGTEVKGIRLFPADIAAKPGQPIEFTVKYLDANGREIVAPADAKLTWSLPQPPLPPTAPMGATPPPALNGEIKDGKLILGKLPRQQGTVLVTYGNFIATARVRVAANVPYTEDFEKVPAGAVPGGWMNTQGKYTVVEKDGNKVLSKVNNDSRPPIARANAYMTLPNATGYTVQAEMMSTEVAGKFSDMGLVNSRYTLILDGKSDSANGKRQARLVSWEAKPRINKALEFDWQAKTWYIVKLTVEQKDKTAVAKAKIWKKGEAEPADWMIEFEDPSPNREGSAALYAYVSNVTDAVPGSEILFDNVSLTPNK
ncbi:MAG: PQQ-binding-like beta-propeller repeat protein [Fimbriiglobus sp.]